jgi:hypothetical protein
MANRADINSWIGRFIMWDGMLPFTTWAVPLLIHWLIPNNRAAIELTAVALPIAAFFLRYRSGRPHITSNNCHAVVKRCQVAAFCLGLFVLVLIDAVLVLSHLMPNGATVASTADLVIWASLYATYLTAMAFAMYPGFGGHAPRQAVLPTRV